MEAAHPAAHILFCNGLTVRDKLMILHFRRDNIILWSAETLQDGTRVRFRLRWSKSCSEESL